MVVKSKTLSESQKELWLKVLTKDFMSSEESGEEDIGNDTTRRVLFIKQLKWRSSGVNRFFNKLDQKLDKAKSEHAKQQTLPRVLGHFSCRSKPLCFGENFFWI